MKEVWNSPSPAVCFADRRERLRALFDAPWALGSGVARVRNFEANRYPFRAESHFLYLVGRHLEQALLSYDGERFVLFTEPPDPEQALWHGPVLSLEALSAELGLEVRPSAEYESDGELATLCPDDVESACWLSELLDRELDAGTPFSTDGDLALAHAMIELRLVHDAYALEQMREAARVTAEAHHRAMRSTAPGKREAHVRAELEAVFTAAGMQPAYTSIVTVHGEVLHHASSYNLLAAGDLLLVDAGAEGPEGWAADVTRTWPVSGHFDQLQAEVYDAVLASQAAAIELCKPGVRFRDVHRKAAAVLVEGLREVGLLRGSRDELLASDVAAVFFPHGIGHLLGLDVHDMEDLGDLAGYGPERTRNNAPAERFLRLDRDLRANMVVTIEPGFYRIEQLLRGEAFDGIRRFVDLDVLAALGGVRGIRIEDDVRICEGEPEVLSASVAKTRAQIEAVMARS